MKVHQTLEWLNLLSLGTKGLKPRQQSVCNQGCVTGGGWRGQHLNNIHFSCIVYYCLLQCCQIPPSLHGRFCQKPRPVWTLSLPAKSFFTAGFTADFMATLRLHFYLFHEKNHISNPLTHTHMHQYNKPHSRDMFQTSLLYSEQCQRVIKYITTQ